MPIAIGSAPITNTTGMVEVALLAASDAGVVVAASHLTTNQVGDQRRQSGAISLSEGFRDWKKQRWGIQ